MTTTMTTHLAGGSDTLSFKAGISVSDVMGQASGNNLVVALDNPAKPDGDVQPADGPDDPDELVQSTGSDPDVLVRRRHHDQRGRDVVPDRRVPGTNTLVGHSGEQLAGGRRGRRHADRGGGADVLIGGAAATTLIGGGWQRPALWRQRNRHGGVLRFVGRLPRHLQCGNADLYDRRPADRLPGWHGHGQRCGVLSVLGRNAECGGSLVVRLRRGAVGRFGCGELGQRDRGRHGDRITPDAGSTLSYSLINDAGGRFAIDENTGVITVANGSLLDYEAASSETIVVLATDQGRPVRGQDLYYQRDQCQ